MAVSEISPELALVDPDLRADAVAALDPVEPYDFLRFPEPPPAPVRVGKRRHPPVLLAATVYLTAALIKTVLLDALFVLGLAGLVAGLQLAR
jgi:hypothetical protein